MITGFLNGSIIRGFAGYYGCYILKLLKPSRGKVRVKSSRPAGQERELTEM